MSQYCSNGPLGAVHQREECIVFRTLVDEKVLPLGVDYRLQGDLSNRSVINMHTRRAPG